MNKRHNIDILERIKTLNQFGYHINFIKPNQYLVSYNNEVIENRKDKKFHNTRELIHLSKYMKEGNWKSNVKRFNNKKVRSSVRNILNCKYEEKINELSTKISPKEDDSWNWN